jgi:hypothetical protein
MWCRILGQILNDEAKRLCREAIMSYFKEYAWGNSENFSKNNPAEIWMWDLSNSKRVCWPLSRGLQLSSIHCHPIIGGKPEIPCVCVFSSKIRRNETRLVKDRDWRQNLRYSSGGKCTLGSFTDHEHSLGTSRCQFYHKYAVSFVLLAHVRQFKFLKRKATIRSPVSVGGTVTEWIRRLVRQGFNYIEWSEKIIMEDEVGRIREIDVWCI